MNRTDALIWMHQHSDNERLEQLLDEYYRFLVEQNEVMNLTTIVEEDDVYVKHFYDSALILEKIEITDLRIVDVGSGAGFPGIVLKIIKPNFHLTIVEALEKRCRFLQELVKRLALTDVEIVHDRCEIYASSCSESFDLGICRAVGGLTIMMELMVRLIRLQGMLVFYKGPKWKEELANSASAQHKLHLALAQVISFNQENLGERNLGCFIKQGATPDKYPRNYGQIKKTPLN